MNDTSHPIYGARRLVDLLESVNMSPGERARARAHCEQVEAFIDLAASVARRVRGLFNAASQAVSPTEPLRPAARKPAHF